MRFPKVIINIYTRTTKQSYEQNTRNVVMSNRNNNVGQLYTICDPCKIAGRGYKSHETSDEVSMPIILIAIFYQEKL